MLFVTLIKKSITAKSNSQTPPRKKLACPPHCFHLYMHICTETKRDSLGPKDDVEAHVSKTCILFNGHLRLNAKMT